MRGRKLLVGLCSVLILSSVAAVANHFDGNAGNGTFNPQLSVTVTGTLVNQQSDLTLDLTQTDHEDPVVIADFKTPGDWQFGFPNIRQAEKPAPPAGVPTTDCDDAIDGLENSPDGTGVGGNTDYSKRGEAHFVRAEKIGTGFLKVAADTVTRPGAPAEWSGDAAFVSWNPATKSGSLCILFITTDTRVTHLPDVVPGDDQDDIEGVVEIPAQFDLTQLADGTFWVTHVDISSIVKNSTFQQLNVSVLELKAALKKKTTGNWDSQQEILSKTPLVSGTKTFVGVFKTCPPNDPDYGNCKSDKGPVTKTIDIPIGLPAPAITSPANGALLNLNPVPISGTSDPSAVIRIFEGTTVVVDSPPADGTGHWTAMAPLSDGTHTVFGKTIDAGGQSPASNSITFTIDTVAPGKPAITTPLEGSTQAGVSVPFTGTAEVASKVRLFDGAIFVTQATTPPSGIWAITATLSKGTHIVTVDATDLAGNISLPSDPRSFFVTTAIPIIQIPAEGSSTNNGNVNVTGITEPTATVSLYEGGTLLGTALAVGSSWTIPLTFTEGTHVLNAIAMTPDGFTSPSSPPRTFSVDFTPPAAPVIVFPVEGGIVKTSSVPVSGTSEPLVSVSVYEGTQFLGKGNANAGGTWTVTVTLFNGEHKIHAIATDLAGNIGPSSPEITFTVDDPLKILTPLEKAKVPGSVVISGDADEASTYIYVYETGTLVTTTSVVDGKWTVTQPFTSGIHSITVRALTGSKLSPQTDPRTFTVDAKPPVVTIRRYQFHTLFGIQTEAAGTAYDDAPFDSLVQRVELTWRDFFTGEIVSQHDATCKCPGAKLSWTDDDLPPSLAFYELTAVAYDGVGNASPAQTQLIILI